MPQNVHTMGSIAADSGLPLWKIHNAVKRLALVPSQRIGRSNIYTDAQREQILAEARRPEAKRTASASAA